MAVPNGTFGQRLGYFLIDLRGQLPSHGLGGSSFRVDPVACFSGISVRLHFVPKCNFYGILLHFQRHISRSSQS